MDNLGSQETAGADDPITAALPPKSDPVTYLTILEYQLNASNITTLTKHLSNDDGTLANEIGWDLVKLVLPLLGEAPEAAQKCLEVVARRGNPREVVVRVAEALERIGPDDVADVGDNEMDDDQDELPTFAGEAPRLHVGAMKLDGMPPATPQQPQKAASGIEVESHTPKKVISVLQYQTLLSMSGNLHPRIQTQYPSRFLATSLPAALGAYRRLEVTTSTTSLFVSLLVKLSGKQRPLLPPRTSTAPAPSDDKPVVGETTSPTMKINTAPLPDPEASSRSHEAKTSSPEENAIVSRLLQAVLLELLEEYINSLDGQEQDSLSLTSRLRELHDPRKVVLRSQTEHEKWSTEDSLKEREALLEQFRKLSRDLKLSPDAALNESFNPIDSLTHDTLAPEINTPCSPSEFPTTPAQIPFPRIGVLYLSAIHSFTTLNLSTDQSQHRPDLQKLAHIVKALTTASPTTEAVLLSQLPVPTLDALFSLLYLALHHPDTNQTKLSPASFTQLFLPLAYTCSDHPSPTIRDSAHHIATLLLQRACPSGSLKYQMILSLLSNPNRDMLRAVCVDWVKDDLVALARGRETATDTSDVAVELELEVLLQVLLPPVLAVNEGDGFVLQVPFLTSVCNLWYVVMRNANLSVWFGRDMDGVRALRDVVGDAIKRYKGEAVGGQQSDESLVWSLEDAIMRLREALAAGQ